MLLQEISLITRCSEYYKRW